MEKVDPVVFYLVLLLLVGYIAKLLLSVASDGGSAVVGHR